MYVRVQGVISIVVYMFTFLYWTFISLVVISSLDYLMSRRKKTGAGMEVPDQNREDDSTDLEQALTNYANEILKRHRQATE